MKTAEQKRHYGREYNRNNKPRLRAAAKKFRDKNKEILNAYNRQYIANLTPEKKEARRVASKINNLRSRIARQYGITLEQRDEIFASQGFCCAICKSQSTGKRFWHIDHCHTSKKVRGILCQHCNFMLGQAKDSVEILKSAIKYLRRK